MIWRVLGAEFMKLRRTAAARIAVLAPIAVAILIFFLVSQSPYTMLRRTMLRQAADASDWLDLTRVTLMIWGLLMLPLYITVQSSLVAGIDHAADQWKSILARPVPRYAFYLGKLIVVWTLMGCSTVLLLIGVIASGMLLPHVQRVADFPYPIPAAAIALEGWLMAALAFLALTIQHWISLRFRSFAASTGAGIVATVIGYGMVVASIPNGGLPAYFPWSLPMLVLARWPVNIAAVLSISVLAGCVVTACGCAEFSSREVK